MAQGKPRRAFGSLRELPSGRWQARYRGPDGQVYTAPITFASEHDADLYLDTVRTDLVREAWKAPRRATETVGTYVAEYIEQQVLAGAMKRSTAGHDRNLLRLHITPVLGTVPLSELTLPVVKTWWLKLRKRLAAEAEQARKAAEKKGRKFSEATTRTGATAAAQTYRLLRAAMNAAIEDELIDRNPCRIKGAGRTTAAERPIAAVDEVLELANTVPARYRCLVLLASFLGPRIGELAALRRRDVESGQVAVAERVYYLDGGYDWDDPKSEAGKRRVPAGEALEKEIRKHLELYVPDDPDALVFTTAGGKPVISTYSGWWGRARTKISRPDLRFHDLRHTGQTLAAMSGATEAELMRRMGHSTTSASRVYMHSTEEHADAVAAQLSSVIEAHQAGGNVVPLRPVTRRRATG